MQVFFNFTACFGHECTSSPSLCFMVHFIVDGGHRAIIFSRIGGIQDNIYTEGLHFRYSTAWSNLFTYCHNENIICVCMMHSFLSEMCIRLSLSPRKQLTFGDATTGFPAKRRLRNKRRNFLLMTRHYLDLGSASDWLWCVRNLIQPIRKIRAKAQEKSQVTFIWEIWWPLQ